MVQKLSSEQFWKIYQKIAPELKETYSSEETGNNIYSACEKNDVLDNLEDIIILTGNVLLGVLPQNDFQEEVEKICTDAQVAKKVSQEINRFVFLPVQNLLQNFYPEKNSQSLTQSVVLKNPVEEKIENEEITEKEVSSEKTKNFLKNNKKEDTYREEV